MMAYAPSVAAVDVAIVGGGAIGLAVAYYIRMMDADARIVVIERDPSELERISASSATHGRSL
jgi:L-2-hydroxyglutarate oxidase LhgO